MANKSNLFIFKLIIKVLLLIEVSDFSNAYNWRSRYVNDYTHDTEDENMSDYYYPKAHDRNEIRLYWRLNPRYEPTFFKSLNEKSNPEKRNPKKSNKPSWEGDENPKARFSWIQGGSLGKSEYEQIAKRSAENQYWELKKAKLDTEMAKRDAEFAQRELEEAKLNLNAGKHISNTHEENRRNQEHHEDDRGPLPQEDYQGYAEVGAIPEAEAPARSAAKMKKGKN